MSISLAPASTAVRVSSSFTSRDACPLGKAVATDATAMSCPCSACFATPTIVGYTQTAATCGRPGIASCRWIAFWHSCRTLPGVSWPSRVVRSIIDNTSLRASTFDSVLMLRLVKRATRSSTPTASTVGTRSRSGRRAVVLTADRLIAPQSPAIAVSRATRIMSSNVFSRSSAESALPVRMSSLTVHIASASAPCCAAIG